MQKRSEASGQSCVLPSFTKTTRVCLEVNRYQSFATYVHKNTRHLSVQEPCGPDRSPRMAPALSLGNIGPVSDFNHDLGSAQYHH